MVNQRRKALTLRNEDERESRYRKLCMEYNEYEIKVSYEIKKTIGEHYNIEEFADIFTVSYEVYKNDLFVET